MTDTDTQGSESAPATDVARRDVTRTGVVTVSEIVCLAGTLLGVRVFCGTPVQQAAGGALSADATLIAPVGPAFSIWSVASPRNCEPPATNQTNSPPTWKTGLRHYNLVNARIVWFWLRVRDPG